MICVLRVGAPDFDVDRFLGKHAQLSPDAVWHKGERRAVRGPEDTSGFNLFISKYDTWNEVLRSALEYCKLQSRVLEDARSAGAGLELDFGVEAREGGVYAINARFSPDDIRSLGDAGVTACVTVYPPSRKK